LFDISGGTYENILEMSKKFKAVFIMDHHIGVNEIFEHKAKPNNVFVFYNLEKSGVTLALDFFNGVS